MVDGTRMDFSFFLLSELLKSQREVEMRMRTCYLYHKDGSVSHHKANCFTWMEWWGMLLTLIFPLVFKKYTF